jgi:hypothetical protein
MVSAGTFCTVVVTVFDCEVYGFVPSVYVAVAVLVIDVPPEVAAPAGAPEAISRPNAMGATSAAHVRTRLRVNEMLVI